MKPLVFLPKSRISAYRMGSCSEGKCGRSSGSPGYETLHGNCPAKALELEKSRRVRCAWPYLHPRDSVPHRTWKFLSNNFKTQSSSRSVLGRSLQSFHLGRAYEDLRLGLGAYKQTQAEESCSETHIIPITTHSSAGEEGRQ